MQQRTQKKINTNHFFGREQKMSIRFQKIIFVHGRSSPCLLNFKARPTVRPEKNSDFSPARHVTSLEQLYLVFKPIQLIID